MRSTILPLRLLLTHLVIVMAVVHPCHAQKFLNKITAKRADALYKQMAYKEAAALYETIMKEKPGDGKSMHALGRCYVKLNDPVNMEKWYSRIVVLADADAEDFLNYATALEMNGKSDEAREYYVKFKTTANMDKRGERRLKSFDMRQSILSDSAYYQLIPFGKNTRGDEFSPQYYKDGILFSSNGIAELPHKSVSPWTGTAFYDLYYCRFAGTNDSLYFPPEAISKYINTSFHESAPSLNKGQNQIAFTRSSFNGMKETRGKNKVSHQQIFISSDKAHDWKLIKPFQLNSTEHSSCHPAFTSDGNTMYFASDMQGGFGGMDIYVTRNISGRWTDPVNLGISVNTEGNEVFPFVSKDSLLYFSSTGRPGLGGLDIYYGEISGDQLKNVNGMSYPVNSRFDDFSLIYDADKRTGYFSSNRPGGMGGDDIYRFRNTKPPYRLRIKVIDEESRQALKKVSITFRDDKNTIKKEFVTDSSGVVLVSIEKDKKYEIIGSLQDYFEQTVKVETSGMSGNELSLDLPMFRNRGFSLRGLVKDAASARPLDNVKVIIKDVGSGTNIFSGSTDGTGLFSKLLENATLNQTLMLSIKLEKEGYLTREILFQQKLERSGEIDMNKQAELSLDELKVGVDIGKIVDLNPIYFDSGKWNIRTDAAIELDKIVKAMNDNPSLSIEVGSHTDSKGASKANLSLSDKRAKSTADYIVSKGIVKGRISGKGYGESQLVNKCKDGVKCTDVEHQQNRRTEFKIVKL